MTDNFPRLSLITSMVLLSLSGCVSKEYVQQEVGTMNKRIDDLSTALAAANQKIEGDSQRINISELRISQVETNAIGLTQRADQTETGLKQAGQRIDSVNDGLKATNQRLDVMDTNLASTNKRMQGLEAGLASAGEKLEAVGSGLADTNKRLDTVDSNLGQKPVPVTPVASVEKVEVQAPASETRPQPQPQPQPEQARLDVAVEKTVVQPSVVVATMTTGSDDATTKRLDEIAQQIAKAGQRIDANSQALGLASQRLDVVEHSLADAKTRVEGGEAGLEQTRQQITGMQEQLAKTDEHVASVQKAIGDTDARMLKNEAAVGNINGRLDAVNTDLDTLKTQVTSAENAIATNTDHLVENDKSDTALADRVSKIEVNDATISSTAREALERAIAAGKLAEGKLVYETSLTEDVSGFAFNRSDLSDTAKDSLKKFAEKMLAENKNIYIEIQGHTDSIGDAAFNTALALNRAETVRDFLYKECGIPLPRLSVVSYGNEKPVANNKTREGRAKNRRVTLVVLK